MGVDPGTGTGSPWVTGGGNPGTDDDASSGDEGPSEDDDDGSTSAEPAGDPTEPGGESTGVVDDGGVPPADDGAEVGGGSEGGGAPMGGGDCCVPGAAPGCSDAAVAECVCAEDAFCCEMAWDQQCVDSVDLLGCGACGGADPGGTEGGEEGGGVGGPCCAPTGQPGCGDIDVEICVCDDYGDVYCCVTEWDEQCAQEVTEFGCGAC